MASEFVKLNEILRETNMKKTYNDCFIEYENNVIKIGNSKILREIEIKDNIPVSTFLQGQGYKWTGGNVAMFNVTDFDYKNASVSFDMSITDFGGKSEKALVGELIFKSEVTEIKLLLYVFPCIAAISSKIYVKGKVVPINDTSYVFNTAIELNKEETGAEPVFPEYGVVDSFNTGDKHIKVKAVRLYDETDRYNDLVSSYENLLYRRSAEYFEGSFLIFDNYINKKAFMLVSEGYVSGKKFFGNKDFSINSVAASVFGNGICEDVEDYTYVGGATVVSEKKELLTSEYKKFYSRMYKPDVTYVMSNTWGDRKRDTSVCEEFIKNEIDMGSKIGVDIIQIDDGWQQGMTANSGFIKNGAWGNFYDSDENFWEVNKKKFPGGFNVISDYAKKHNIKLGMWFSMDKNNSYARWQQDADKILELYNKYGVSHFKIDGLRIEDHTSEKNIFNFVEYIDSKSKGEISFNFDITANRRYGYFMAKQYSTLFVENRYTDWGNYYPHRTLRNIWSLSEYIPAHKLQFEVLNQLRNDEKYQNDYLKPSSYFIDYMFISVMVSNPLIWMEMSGLNEEQENLLRKVICVYKKERNNFINMQINPIGMRPDGIAYTGFDITNEHEGYLILLKEKSEENSYSYRINKKIKSYEILASNCPDAVIECENEAVTVSSMIKSGYIFLKYTL